MSDYEDHLTASRAKQAAELKNNPVWNEGWTLIRATIVDKMQKVKAKDVDEILELKRTLDNLNRLERTFERFIDDGKMVEHKRSRLNPFKT